MTVAKTASRGILARCWEYFSQLLQIISAELEYMTVRVEILNLSRQLETVLLREWNNTLARETFRAHFLNPLYGDLAEQVLEAHQKLSASPSHRHQRIAAKLKSLAQCLRMKNPECGPLVMRIHAREPADNLSLEEMRSYAKHHIRPILAAIRSVEEEERR